MSILSIVLFIVGFGILLPTILFADDMLDAFVTWLEGKLDDEPKSKPIKVIKTEKKPETTKLPVPESIDQLLKSIEAQSQCVRNGQLQADLIDVFRQTRKYFRRTPHPQAIAALTPGLREIIAEVGLYLEACGNCGTYGDTGAAAGFLGRAKATVASYDCQLHNLAAQPLVEPKQLPAPAETPNAPKAIEIPKDVASLIEVIIRMSADLRNKQLRESLNTAVIHTKFYFEQDVDASVADIYVGYLTQIVVSITSFLDLTSRPDEVASYVDNDAQLRRLQASIDAYSAFVKVSTDTLVAGRLAAMLDSTDHLLALGDVTSDVLRLGRER